MCVVGRVCVCVSMCVHARACVRVTETETERGKQRLLTCHGVLLAYIIIRSQSQFPSCGALTENGLSGVLGAVTYNYSVINRLWQAGERRPVGRCIQKGGGRERERRVCVCVRERERETDRGA